MENNTLLEVKNLSTSFFTEDGEVKAVRGVSLKVREGETLGFVGESGCGKSVTALSIMKLIPSPGRIMGGEVYYKGKDLLKLTDKEIREIRGKEIALIFQEPLTSLNPVFNIGEQIVEAIRIHQNVGKKEALKRAVEMLESVGIPEPQRRVKDYPHQLSGGMRQRAMIAMALSCNPNLLIADEPTTALDVTIQAQILELMERIQKERNMAMIFITHDLGVISETVDNVAVMYCGKIVEYTSTKSLIKEPLHPYTKALLESIPLADEDNTRPLKVIKGSVPNLLDLPKGCSFYDRCGKAEKNCKNIEPKLEEVKKDHWVSCLQPCIFTK